MDYKFLDKVLGQILRETDIIEDRGHIFVNYPFTKYGGISINLPVGMKWFLVHCKEVYGLNDDEIKYVWDEYKTIIKDKIITIKKNY